MRASSHFKRLAGWSGLKAAVTLPHSRIAAILLALAATTAFAESPRALLDKGNKLYEKGDHEKTLEAYQKAAEGAPAAKLDSAVPSFNEGNALFRLGRFDESQNRYGEALKTPDLALQGRAFYNRGNALFSQAGAAEQAGQIQPALQALEMALTMYENAMTLDPGEPDTKTNFELALKKKEILEQLQQQQDQQQQDQKQDEQNKDQQKQDQQGDQQEQPKDQEDPQDQQQQDQQQQSSDQQQAEMQQPSEDMTPEEARMLLDAMKDEEQAKREQLRIFMGKPVPVQKDW